MNKCGLDCKEAEENVTVFWIRKYSKELHVIFENIAKLSLNGKEFGKLYELMGFESQAQSNYSWDDLSKIFYLLEKKWHYSVYVDANCVITISWAIHY